ncbi:unnamed protein product [Prunus armeniaca]
MGFLLQLHQIETPSLWDIFGGLCGIRWGLGSNLAVHIIPEQMVRQRLSIGPLRWWTIQNIERVGQNAYVLEFPNDIGVSLTFNVADLQAYYGENGTPDVDSRSSPFQPEEADVGASQAKLGKPKRSVKPPNYLKDYCPK